MKYVIITLLVVAFVGSTAYSTTLTFDDLGLPSGQTIPGDYGDRTGNTPNVVVSYRERDGFGGASLVLHDNLTHWQNGYGDLINVAWGHSFIVGGNNPDRVAEISFSADDGWSVLLESFDLGGWANDRPDRSVHLYDESYHLLASYGPLTILGGLAHSSFAPGVESRTIHLQWDYPYRVAIDNITFEQRGPAAAVPDQASSLGLLALGMGLLAASRRCRWAAPAGRRGRA